MELGNPHTPWPHPQAGRGAADGNLCASCVEVLAIADYTSQGETSGSHKHQSKHCTPTPGPSPPRFCLPGDSNKRAGRAAATIKRSRDLINLPTLDAAFSWEMPCHIHKRQGQSQAVCLSSHSTFKALRSNNKRGNTSMAPPASPSLCHFKAQCAIKSDSSYPIQAQASFTNFNS